MGSVKFERFFYKLFQYVFKVVPSHPEIEHKQ